MDGLKCMLTVIGEDDALWCIWTASLGLLWKHPSVSMCDVKAKEISQRNVVKQKKN